MSRAQKARGPRVVWFATAALLLATAGVFAYTRVEDYLIDDPRFALRRSTFFIAGRRHLSEAEVQRIFARDLGRSVYLCPLKKRRLELLAVDWVEDATLSRVWPNRLTVTVRERRPIAWADVLMRDGSQRSKLIDADGMLLDPVKLRGLPLLTGLREQDTMEMRHERVARLVQLSRELGPMMARVAEVDAGDVSNVKVTHIAGGRALVLMLGDRDFEPRMRKFFDYYPEISRRMPEATVLDLRLRDSILAAGDHRLAVKVGSGKE